MNLTCPAGCKCDSGSSISSTLSGRMICLKYNSTGANSDTIDEEFNTGIFLLVFVGT